MHVGLKKNKGQKSDFSNRSKIGSDQKFNEEFKTLQTPPPSKLKNDIGTVFFNRGQKMKN